MAKVTKEDRDGKCFAVELLNMYHTHTPLSLLLTLGGQNIRVIAHYYTRIRMDRLNELLDLTKEQTEVILCEQVVEGRVYARIDRPAGVVTFQTARGENELLNAWMQDVDDLLTNVATVGHLIAKEEMVHQIKL